MLDLLIILCFLLEDVKVWPIAMFESQCDPANLDSMSPDVIIDALLYTIGVSSQIILRLYLRCIKKVQNSDSELISIKVWIIHLIMYVASILFVYEKWFSLNILYDLLQYVAIPLTILFNHSGFNNYYMSNHPDLRDALNVFWLNLTVCYFQQLEYLSNCCRSNQIQPHDVIG